MIDKYKQAFQEEAREILVELEAALLQLNENRGDSELVGRAFRALHTIKGSGAMFGFDNLAAFTHNLENAFDEVRNGRLQVTSELINPSLAALDQIKGMLEEAAGHSPNRYYRDRYPREAKSVDRFPHSPLRRYRPGFEHFQAIGRDDGWADRGRERGRQGINILFHGGL